MTVGEGVVDTLANGVWTPTGEDLSRLRVLYLAWQLRCCWRWKRLPDRDVVQWHIDRRSGTITS